MLSPPSRDLHTASSASQGTAKAAAEIAAWTARSQSEIYERLNGPGTEATSSVASVTGMDEAAQPLAMPVVVAAEAACESSAMQEGMEGMTEQERLLQQQQLLLLQQQQLEEQQLSPKQQLQLQQQQQLAAAGVVAGVSRGSSGRSSAHHTGLVPAAAPVAPFSPPDAVKTWLRTEDWEALSRAWEEAEAQAIAWAEGEGDDFEDEAYFDDGVEASRSASAVSSAICTTSVTSSIAHSRMRRGRPKWDEDFALLGQDSRRPPPMRRYFDGLPAETIPPVQAVRREFRPKQTGPFRTSLDEDCDTGGRDTWIDCWGSTASTDNDKLHPHLRHYFGNRGMEASYRQRPHVDCKWLKDMKPRTPGRPSTREKLDKWRSASEGALLASPSPGRPKKEKVVLDAGTRGAGSITWGNRCLMYGPEEQVKKGPTGEQIPWVYDHHISETEDNEIMNPTLRHYFDKDGVESSFRNRGRHYGRSKKMCFGLDPIPQGAPSPKASPESRRQSSIHGASPGSFHPSQQGSRQPSQQGSMYGSQHPSQQGSRQPSQQSAHNSQHSVHSAAAMQPAAHSQQASPQLSRLSRHASAPASLQPSRRPSLPSRNPSMQAPGSAAAFPASQQPFPASQASPQPSRQASAQMSRHSSLHATGPHRVGVGSVIGSVAGSIVGSVEASEMSRRSVAAALPAC